MTTYDVTIHETISKTYRVKANTEAEAVQQAAVVNSGLPPIKNNLSRKATVEMARDGAND